MTRRSGGDEVRRSGAPPGFWAQVGVLLLASAITAGLALAGLWFVAAPLWVLSLAWVSVVSRRGVEADARDGVDRSAWETRTTRRIALLFVAAFVVGGLAVVAVSVVVAVQS